ncbi:extensin family protein [Aquabacterium sp. J223]|uniref:extensin-like domain-containing protein n=1 Tax=Aquabacterium sp. J223 TaxID=2898431 RepID=UPI0021ADD218|nr:extensin family protein [Aquabacterium sp. J223]UUX97408.1 extensin family protein [Aquabacterium sp. J223]
MPAPVAGRGWRRRLRREALALLGHAGPLVLVVAAAWHLPLPWNPFMPLDVRQPAGPLDRAKLRRLGDRPAACHAFLESAGQRFEPLPDRAVEAGCGWRDAVRVGGGPGLRWSPVPLTCHSAAALALWQHRVLQPQARAAFGQPVQRLEHFGSYACRDVAGTGRRSGHARARALDVAGVVLADGRRITVSSHWDGPPDAAAFLRALRDGACASVDQVLSPDHNAAHRDHLHLEQGGWRACR